MLYVILLVILFVLGTYGLLLGLHYADFPYQLSGRKITVILSALLMALTLETAGLWGWFQTPTPQAAMAKSGTYTLAYITSALMRAKIKFPQPVNENIQLETIRSAENRLVYVMSMKAQDSETFLHMVKTVNDDMRTNGCQRDDYKTLMTYGLGIEIDFRVLGAWGAEPIILTPEMCKGR